MMMGSTIVLLASLVLSANDRPSPSGAIVLPDDPTPTQCEAAKELEDYLKRITGNGPAVPVRIVAGDASLGTDGFRLTVKNGGLTIAGGQRGVLYGVYEVLERFGGCGWFSSTTEVVPTRARVELPDNLDERHMPAFLMRTMSWQAAEKPQYAVRLRLNGHTTPALPQNLGSTAYSFADGAGICHTFHKLCRPRIWFESHPEYFSEIDGRRRGGEQFQLCLTNPDVLKIVVSNVLDRLAASPWAKFVGVSQNDNFNYCRCAACAAVDREEGSPSGLLLRFVNAVAEEVEKVRPDVYVQTLIYQYTEPPPKRTRPRHNVVPCVCSIGCYRHQPIAKGDPGFMEHLRTWGRLSDKLYVWDYTVNFKNCLYPMPIEDVLQANLKMFRDNSVKFMFEEGGEHHADFAELKAWLLAKWMWNPDLDEKTLLDRFFDGYYGAAAPFVRKYYDACRALQRKNRPTLGIFDAQPAAWYTPAFAAEALQTLAQAARAVRDDPVRLRNVRYTALCPLAVELDTYAETAKRFYVTRHPEKFPARTDLDVAYRRFLELVDLSKRTGEEIRLPFCKERSRQLVYGGGIDRTAKDAVSVNSLSLTTLFESHVRRDPENLVVLPTSGNPMARLAFRNVAFDAEATYEVSFRAKVVKGTRDGAAFRATLGDEAIERRCGEIGDDWQRYAFKPRRLTDDLTFEFGSGPWERGGGTGTTKEVVLGNIEIVRKGGRLR